MPEMLVTPQFVSCTGSEGISALRKIIYRIGTGGFRTTLPSLLSIAMELPTIYTQIESLVRQLRTHLRSLRNDGEQKPFYTLSELKECLRRPLKQLAVTGMDFYAALRLLHEVCMDHVEVMWLLVLGEILKRISKLRVCLSKWMLVMLFHVLFVMRSILKGTN